MKALILSISMLLVIGTTALAQFDSFNQPQNAPMQINPALIGGDSAIKVGVATRRYVIPGSIQTLSTVFGTTYLPRLNAYTGISYTRDDFSRVAGKLHTRFSSVNAFYAQDIYSKEGLTLRIGLKAGLFHRFTDFNNLEPFEESIYGVDAPRSGPQNGLDLGFGAMVYYKGFTFSGSLDHLNKPNIGLYGNQEELYPVGHIMASHDILLNPVLRFQPYVHVIIKHHMPIYASFGSTFVYRGITLGASVLNYRFKEEKDPSIQGGYQNNRICALISTVWYTSKLTTQNYNTVELSFTYKVFKTGASEKFVPTKGIFF